MKCLIIDVVHEAIAQELGNSKTANVVALGYGGQGQREAAPR